MSNANHLGSLSVTRFWLHQGSLLSHDDGARVELTDGSQHVFVVAPSGSVDGLECGPARDAVLASVVPHAVATLDDSSNLCAGWDSSFGAAELAADLHYAATHGEAA